MEIGWTLVEIVAVAVLWLLAGISVGFLFPRRQREIFSFCLGWVIPGGGHFFLGRRERGALFLVALVATFVAGAALTGFQEVPFAESPLYAVGRFGSATFLVLAEVLSRREPFSWIGSRFLQPGLLYMCVSGILNVVVMLSLWDLGRPAQPVLLGPPPAARD